jgi:hypothetical protein
MSETSTAFAMEKRQRQWLRVHYPDRPHTERIAAVIEATAGVFP